MKYKMNYNNFGIKPKKQKKQKTNLALNKTSKNSKVNNFVPLSNNGKKKKVGRVIASVLAVSALAGGLTFCLTNDKVKTWLGIGSEVIETETKDDAEIKDLKSKINVLEDSVKILKEDKEKLILERDTALKNHETAVSERDAFKSQLDAEKELTEEQQTRLTELETRVESTQNALTNAENALAEKEALISNLENQILILQQQLSDLQEIVNEYTNSVKERVSTYEMKYDTAEIKSIFKDGNDLLLASVNSVEYRNLETNEQKQIILNSSVQTTHFYKIKNKIYISNPLVFGYLDEETKEFVNLNFDNLNYNRIQGNLEEIKYLEDGTVFVKTDNSIVLINSDDEFTFYRINAYLNDNETIYFKGCSANTSDYGLYKIENFKDVTQLVLMSFNDINYGGTEISKIDNNLYYKFRTGYNSLFILKKFNLDTLEETNFLSNVNNNFSKEFTFLKFNDELFFTSGSSYNVGIYRVVDGVPTKLSSITNANYYDLKIVNGYLFDSTFSYVYNKETGDFQLALSSASTTNKDEFLVNNGSLILTYKAKYFDESTLTFKDFNYELSDYSSCDYSVLEVNGKLFCSSNTTSATKQGVFYIDLETKTIKKVPDTGNGDILNTGYLFKNAISANENMALIFNSLTYYAVLINTELIQVENVFTGFTADTVLYDNLLISHLNNNIKIFNTDTLELKTIYSRESTASLTISYIENNKVYFSTKNAGTNVILNLNDFSVSYEYGLGNVEIDTLKLGFHSSASTLYDPSTGDLMHIKGLSNSPTLYDFEDRVMFINGTMVYSVNKKA